jgi:hypothetical protein
VDMWMLKRALGDREPASQHNPTGVAAAPAAGRRARADHVGAGRPPV